MHHQFFTGREGTAKFRLSKGLAVAAGVTLVLGMTALPAAAATGSQVDVGHAPQAGPGGPGPSYPVVASGLDNPRGLAFAPNGDLYVAEAGHGGGGACIPSDDDPTVDTCFGATGAITQIHNGSATQVVTGLPSHAPQVATQGGQMPPGAQATGPSDVAAIGADKIAFTIGLGSSAATRDSKLVVGAPLAQRLGTLSSSDVPGTAAAVTKIADIAAFEDAHNPVPPKEDPDSNANAVLVDGDGYLVVDSGANDLLRVDSSGAVSLVATFPSVKGCAPVPMAQSVPTSVVRGPDGALYVSELTGFPFCEGGASIYKVQNGEATVYAAGLTNVTGLAFAKDGTLYAVELAQHGLQKGPIGAVVAIPKGGGHAFSDYRLVAAGLMAPYGITVQGKSAYVTVGSVLPVMAGGGSVVKIPLAGSPLRCPPNPFPDVASTNSACANIAWLKAQGITKPAGGLYHPTNSVNRGSMTAFLFRLTHPGQASPKCTAKPFPDVATSDVFCGYIQWAKNSHIAVGYPNGSYGPHKAVTRGAMAALLHRIATDSAPTPKCTSKPFADVEVNGLFCGAIAWMKTNNITYGVGGGDYGTTRPVTRQAMASFLHRFHDLS